MKMLKKWLRWNCRIWHWGRKIGTKQVDHNNKGINQNTIERNNFSGSRYPIFGPSRFLLPYIWTFVTFGLLDICFVNTLCLTHCNHQVSLGRNVVSVRPATQCSIEWHRIPVKEQETVSLLGNLNLNLLKCEKHKATNEFLDSLSSNIFLLYIIQPTRITSQSKSINKLLPPVFKVVSPSTLMFKIITQSQAMLSWFSV